MRPYRMKCLSNFKEDCDPKKCDSPNCQRIGCRWKWNDGLWETECGYTFVFATNAEPEMLDVFEFCPYCGEEINIKDDKNEKTK